MGKQTLIQMPPGVDELYSLLDFLNNKTAYKKAMDDLKGMVDKANAAVAAKGKVQEIDNLYALAKQDKSQAEALLNDARRKAEQVVESAKGEIDGQKQQVQAFNERVAKREREVAERARAVDVREREAMVRENESSQVMKHAQDMMNEANQLMDASLATKEEYEQKVQDLRTKFASIG